jgi:hypothetical protein
MLSWQGLFKPDMQRLAAVVHGVLLLSTSVECQDNIGPNCGLATSEEFGTIPMCVCIESVEIFRMFAARVQTECGPSNEYTDGRECAMVECPQVLGLTRCIEQNCSGCGPSPGVEEPGQILWNCYFYPKFYADNFDEPMPESLAFSDVSALFPTNITTIRPGAFAENPELERLQFLGNNVATFKNGTFRGLDSLNMLEMPYQGVTNIEEGAFDQVPMLKIID